MVDEISLIGWRNDIGAYLVMQYPRQLPLSTQDIMQIYTAHRQNALYPNFTTLKNNRGKNIASFFSGMKTTEYVGAPNFIISLYLDESESPGIFRDLLPQVASKILIKLFNMFPKLFDQLKDVEGIIFFTEDEDIKGFPILSYPDDLKISSKLKSNILEEIKKARETIFKVDEQNFIGFFMGTDKDAHLTIPNCFIVYLVSSEIDPASLRKKLSKISRVILKEFSNLLARALEEINDQKLELMIEDGLKEHSLLEEKDIERISGRGGEPDILIGEESYFKTEEPETASSFSESKVDQMLERIRAKTQTEVSEFSKELVAEEQSGVSSATQEELLNQIDEKDELISELQDKIAELEKLLAAKEQKLKKMDLLVKSLRNKINSENNIE